MIFAQCHASRRNAPRRTPPATARRRAAPRMPHRAVDELEGVRRHVVECKREVGVGSKRRRERPYLLHSVGLSLLTTESSRASGVRTPMTYTVDALNERVVLRLAAPAAAGELVTLHITYSANISKNNLGLYNSPYTDDEGKTVPMLVTQFESTYARHAFLSYDEPALKATFQLTVDGVPAGFTALNNMPVLATSPRSDGGSRRACAAKTKSQ